MSSNSRIGLVLFSLYLLFYVGFVAVNAFSPERMEQSVMSSLNLALVYGFGLIIGAVVMSGVYGLISRDSAEPGDVKEA